MVFLRGGCLTEAIEKVKSTKNEYYGTTFMRLRVRGGGCVVGVWGFGGSRLIVCDH